MVHCQIVFRLFPIFIIFLSFIFVYFYLLLFIILDCKRSESLRISLAIFNHFYLFLFVLLLVCYYLIIIIPSLSRFLYFSVFFNLLFFLFRFLTYISCPISFIFDLPSLFSLPRARFFARSGVTLYWRVVLWQWNSICRGGLWQMTLYCLFFSIFFRMRAILWRAVFCFQPRDGLY